MSEVKDALTTLKQIARYGPNSEVMGICDNLSGSSDLLRELAKGWPEHSGSITYPVPDPDHPGDAPAARRIYHRTYYLWDRNTPYGAARWRLLEWCIAQLENLAEDAERDCAPGKRRREAAGDVRNIKLEDMT